MKITKLILLTALLAVSIAVVWQTHRLVHTSNARLAEARRRSEQNTELAVWYTRYSMLTTATTNVIYTCDIEAEGKAYHPSTSGPVCRSACVLLDQVNQHVQAAPPGVVDPHHYVLDKPDWCKP